MAKGVEDTAFYRWTHLVGLCEVGGDPERFALSPDRAVTPGPRAQQRSAPLGDDRRCRPTTPSAARTSGRASACSPSCRASGRRSSTRCAPRRPRTAARLLDGRTENLLWQTLAGTWTDDGPIAEDRLVEYLTKAIREAKTRTTWTAPDEAYEDAVLDARARRRWSTRRSRELLARLGAAHRARPSAPRPWAPSSSS